MSSVRGRATVITVGVSAVILLLLFTLLLLLVRDFTLNKDRRTSERTVERVVDDLRPGDPDQMIVPWRASPRTVSATGSPCRRRAASSARSPGDRAPRAARHHRDAAGAGRDRPGQPRPAGPGAEQPAEQRRTARGVAHRGGRLARRGRRRPGGAGRRLRRAGGRAGTGLRAVLPAAGVAGPRPARHRARPAHRPGDRRDLRGLPPHRRQPAGRPLRHAPPPRPRLARAVSPGPMIGPPAPPG